MRSSITPNEHCSEIIHSTSRFGVLGIVPPFVRSVSRMKLLRLGGCGSPRTRKLGSSAPPRCSWRAATPSYLSGGLRAREYTGCSSPQLPVLGAARATRVNKEVPVWQATLRLAKAAYDAFGRGDHGGSSPFAEDVGLGPRRTSSRWAARRGAATRCWRTSARSPKYWSEFSVTPERFLDGRRRGRGHRDSEGREQEGRPVRGSFRSRARVPRRRGSRAVSSTATAPRR